MIRPVVVAAVLYEPKVSVIWDIIRDFFEENGAPTDVVFYANYELQVEALLGGQIDVAWNSPLAWLDSHRLSAGRCRAIAMRDTDRDRTSHIVVRRGGAIAEVSDLQGRTVSFGAQDSPQATLIPLGFLLRHGMGSGVDFQARRFDVLVGKHGDHVGGELDAFMSLARGEADACAVLDLNWARWSGDGTADPDKYGVLATTDRFDHCVFTAREKLPHDVERRWVETLFSMSYNNPAHRQMMDLEGLKRWLPGRTTGFGLLRDAVERQLVVRGAAT